MAEQPAMDWADQGASNAEMYASFMVPAMFEPFAEWLLDAAGAGPGHAVLDVACGTGAISRAAARRAGREGRVTGVDRGPHMLAVARATGAEPGAAPITYLEGSAEALPVEDASFDAATCHHGLQFFGDRDRALRELRRALRPGGRAAVACWGPVEQQPHFAALADAIERHLGEEAAGLIRSPYALGDRELLTGLLTGAGFTGVRVETATRPVVYASHEGYARSIIAGGPLAARFAAAPAEEQEAVATEVADALRDRRTDDGRLASEMTSFVAIGTA
jgi:ubiquinone/menaquinone biosynthesis C-methylase UbiE